MTASAAQPHIAQIRTARRIMFVMWALTALFIGGFIVYIAEDAKPGYSFMGQLLWSSESVAAARQAVEDGRARDLKFQREQAERRAKWRAERSFAKANIKAFSAVFCPNVNWKTLAPEDKQRVRNVMKEDNALLIESDACP